MTVWEVDLGAGISATSWDAATASLHQLELRAAGSTPVRSRDAVYGELAVAAPIQAAHEVAAVLRVRPTAPAPPDCDAQAHSALCSLSPFRHQRSNLESPDVAAKTCRPRQRPQSRVCGHARSACASVGGPPFGRERIW